MQNWRCRQNASTSAFGADPKSPTMAKTVRNREGGGGCWKPTPPEILQYSPPHRVGHTLEKPLVGTDAPSAVSASAQCCFDGGRKECLSVCVAGWVRVRSHHLLRQLLRPEIQMGTSRFT